MQRREKNIPLLAAMAESGINGQTLAARCGISAVTISHALNRRVDPKPATVEAMARALGRSPAQIGFPPESEGGDQ